MRVLVLPIFLAVVIWLLYVIAKPPSSTKES
ncbi:MAG: hypothetical protein QOD06_311 [Candidatus Binatota bacterium]|jgi:hypothetical protein|nr:hypothetical protein [Candidatus Binatota bacterium]